MEVSGRNEDVIEGGERAAKLAIKGGAALQPMETLLNTEVALLNT